MHHGCGSSHYLVGTLKLVGVSMDLAYLYHQVIKSTQCVVMIHF
jgi:hypothetical protein